MSTTLYKKPDGSFVSVDDQFAEKARAKGYVPATPEQLEASRHPVQAFAEGAVRGGLLGGGDVLTIPFEAGFTGKPVETVRKEVKARKEENPLAAGGGEMVGAVGTAVASGGGASALFGGGVRGAIVEGGLYGMGTMVSESALDNSPLTAERLAAGFASGALVSGAVSGAFAGIQKGVSLGMSKFGGQGLRGALANAADAIEKRTLQEGAGAVAVRKLKQRGGTLEDVVEYAKQEGIPIQFTPEVLDAARAKLAATGQETADLVAKLDGVAPLSDIKNRVGVMDKVTEALRTKYKGDIAAEQEVEAFIQKWIEPLSERTDLKWPELYQLQSRLRGKVEAGAEAIKKEVYDAGRKTLRDVIFSEAGAINPGVEGQLKSLQAKYAKGSFLTSALENRIGRLDASGPTGIGLMDVVRGGGAGASMGGAVGGPVGAALGGVVGAYANHEFSKRGGAFVARALRTMAESKVTSGVANNLASHLGGILSVMPEALGAYRYPLAKAAALGADALMEEHLRLASGPTGSDYLAHVALPVETPEEVDAAGARMAVLHSISEQADQTGLDVQRAVDGLFGSAPGRKTGPALTTLDAKSFMALRENLLGMLQSPEKAFEAIPAEVRAAAPALSGQIANNHLIAAQFLASKMPKNPHEGIPAALAPKWEPSPADLTRFNRALEAVVAPDKALANIAKGYMTQEQVDALRAVYPAIYEDLRAKIVERLGTYGKQLQYQQKLGVQMLLGGQGGMSQLQMQILQAAQAVQAPTGNPPQGGGMSSPDGRQKVDQNKNAQTQGQRMEAR